MRTPPISLLSRLALGLLAVVCCSCSPQAKKEGHLKNAAQFFDAQQYDKAELEYMNVLQIEPLNAQAIGGLGLIYHDQGRLGRVIPYLIKGQQLQPDNLDLRLKLGLISIATGNPKQARDEANFILDRKPLDEEAPLLLADTAYKPDEIEATRLRLQSLPPAATAGAPVLIALGTLELRQRHFKEAEAAFQHALTQNPHSSAAHAALGASYLAQRDLPKAELEFKQAAELARPYSSRQLLYAKIKLQNGDVETARRVLLEITAKTPDYLPAWIILAEISATEKKYPECATLIAKVLARDPIHPEAMLLNARLKLAQGENAQAVAELEKMLKAYPKSAQAHFQLGAAYSTTGEPAKAMASLNQALVLAPGYPDAVILLAELNLRKGDANSAIPALQALIQQHPDITQARFLLADGYRSRGDFTEALAVYRKIEELFPQDPQASYWRGIVLLQQKKSAEARQAFNRAVELAPNYVPPADQLVNLDLTEKNFPAARQRAEDLITRNPKQSSAYLLQAKVFLTQGDFPQTENALHKAIELQPDSPLAYLLLARLYASTRQLDKALTNFQAVTTKNPRDVEALMMTGTLLDQQGNFPAAGEAYEKLLAVNPRFSPALNNLAYLYAEKLNQLDRAKELAQKAREILPHEPHTGDTLGWILYKKQDYTWALGLLTESAAKLPDSAEVMFHLGMTHYMMGNEESARDALQHALQLDSHFPGSDEARQRLSILAIDPSSAGAGNAASLEKTLTEHPDDPIVLARLAASYTAAGTVDKAITTYRNALEKNPKNVPAMIALTQLYAANHDTAKALELARNARKLAPGDPALAHLLGRLAFQTGDFQWAASLLQESAQANPDDPETLYDLAEARYSVGRVADAEAAMQHALQTKPLFRQADDARRFLAMTALAENPAPAAADQVEQIIKNNPGDVPALMARAALSEQKSDAGSAMLAYEKVLSVFPDFYPAKKRLVIYYAAHPGEDKKAADLAVKAREALPNDPELAKAFGLIVYRMGDYAKAVALLRESAGPGTQDAELMYYLGAAQFRLKQPADSRRSLQRALELNLRPDLATDARRILQELK